MAKFGIGQAVRRVEDRRFLLGQGRYVDDISLPEQCYAVTVLSPHAHARIKRIDVAKAKAAPGVLCVLAGADAAAEKLGSFTAHLMPEDFGAPKGHRTFQPLLNAERVRFVGDRVAFVVAETLSQARDAAEESYTLYTTSQNPHGVRMEMSHIFHVPENRIRVISPDVGGGFGLKGNTFPDDALVVWAARRLRRPVKWVASRSESMLTDHCGREMVYYGELALDEHGKILALRAKCLFQLGAYFVGAALAAGAFSVRFIPEAYDIQTMHILSQGLFTNTSQSGPYRGAGRPEAAYFMERLIEHAARVIGMDPAEIRRRNLIPPSKLPYATPTLWNYDSGEFQRLMDKCIELSDWNGFAARKKASQKNGKLRGRAVSYYIEFGGIFNERMELRFDPGGTLTILGGTHSHGQGHATVFAQLVHEWLGVPLEDIRYVQGDTAQVPIGRGTYGARSATVGGNALKAASEAIVEKGKQLSAAMMEADAADIEFKDGQYRVVGTDKAITITEVAKAAYAPMGPLTDKFGVGLEASGSYSANPPSHPNGAHVCELEVDPETGTVGAPPTVINALIDALAPLGVDRIDMPATPLRVWEAISRARASAPAQTAA